jgi:hypothetical protein
VRSNLDQIEDLSSVTPGDPEITPIPLLISGLSVQFFTKGGVTPEILVRIFSLRYLCVLVVRDGLGNSPLRRDPIALASPAPLFPHTQRASS